MKSEREYLREQAALARAAMRHTARSLQVDVKQRVDRAGDWIEKNPLLSLGGAVAASTLIGILLGRTRNGTSDEPKSARAAARRPRPSPVLDSILGSVRPLVQNVLLGFLTGLLATETTKTAPADTSPPAPETGAR